MNILKNIIITILFIKLIKKKIYNNINESILIKKNIKLKNKKIRVWKKMKKEIIYFGYTLCENKCLKVIKKIKNENIKKNNNFIFISINKKENLKIIFKNINKIKKNKIYGINNNKKKLNKISKIFKIVYKYKDKKINHSSIIYKKNKKNKFIIKN